MPDFEGDASVSKRQPDEEELRRAFQSLAGSPGGECRPDDLNDIWSALRGELPPGERGQLVERLAVDPALAEAWRIANELLRDRPGPVTAVRPRAFQPAARWLAAA